ncbi:DNA-directed RNA polymerase subunit beta [Thermoactinomyces sp. DSM 45892]|uniref:DNA-directed RNA polymerase subunit beta n=1 Tax=Thermoactinomyces sp. DSM 45892 TaxID=1882753 RepID=UPI00089995BD|nr:DNA-directed RNA polymerase subunit beta [Thermoactinomyces sp. DSM 45892]SDZ21610.1 DNA-directed RNA polymerase subunit beta [Thermoactinomyces sp. DSM 45892]
MSQLDREKEMELDEKNHTDTQEDRVMVGKLKWSQKEEEKRTDEGLNDEFKELKKEEGMQGSEDSKEDKLANFEDTLSPLDFKEYKVDLEQLQEASAAVETPLKEENTTVLDDEEDLKKEEHAQDEVVKTSFEAHDNEQERVEPIDQEDQEGIANEIKPETKRSPLKAAIKIFWIPMLLIAALITGLVIGNTIIGGKPISDTFSWSSWEHLYNLIYQK